MLTAVFVALVAASGTAEPAHRTGDVRIVSAETDGTIAVVATPMTRRADGVWEYRLYDGTVVTHDPAKFDPKAPHPRVEFNPRDKLALKDNPEKWVPYYKLREGDVVTEGQIVCVLDESKVLARAQAATTERDCWATATKLASEAVSLQIKLMVAIGADEDQLAVLDRLQNHLFECQAGLDRAQVVVNRTEALLIQHSVKKPGARSPLKDC